MGGNRIEINGSEAKTLLAIIARPLFNAYKIRKK